MCMFGFRWSDVGLRRDTNMFRMRYVAKAMTIRILFDMKGL